MNKLLDVNNELITNLIAEAYPTYDGIKIRNKLLDGSYHIQSIGDPLKKMNIKCNVKEQGKIMIDESYNMDKPIRLEWYDKFYIGLIEEYPEWEIIVKGRDNKRIYIATLIIAVTEEGTV